MSSAVALDLDSANMLDEWTSRDPARQKAVTLRLSRGGVDAIEPFLAFNPPDDPNRKRAVVDSAIAEALATLGPDSLDTLVEAAERLKRTDYSSYWRALLRGADAAFRMGPPVLPHLLAVLRSEDINADKYQLAHRALYRLWESTDSRPIV